MDVLFRTNVMRLELKENFQVSKIVEIMGERVARVIFSYHKIMGNVFIPNLDYATS